MSCLVLVFFYFVHVLNISRRLYCLAKAKDVHAAEVTPDWFVHVSYNSTGPFNASVLLLSISGRPSMPTSVLILCVKSEIVSFLPLPSQM